MISTCCIEFNQYKTWIHSITVFYNTLKHNRIILYQIWYLLHDEPTVLYIFQNSPSIVSACCIEFNHYKRWVYSITVFYNTLKHNRIILYHIWYLLHDEPTVLYIPEYSQYWFQHAVLNLITTRREFTLYYSILQHSKA